MANSLELIDKSHLINDKIKEIVTNIKRDIANSTIRSKTEAFIRLRDDVNTFIKSLVAPTLDMRLADRFPVSQDINDMLHEISNDMQYLFKSANNTLSILDASFNKISIERNLLLNTSKYIGKKVDDLDKEITEMFGATIYEIFTETFINRDNIDESIISGTPAFIDTQSGLLTLFRNSVTKYDSGLYIAITDNSNGFPGDTHQASASGGSVVYSGGLEPHTNLSAILDNNKDTWFEYEGIKVDKNDYKSTNGFGFEYKEGISWLMTSNKLVMEFQLTSGIDRLMNWFTIDPFLPTERAYIPAKITSIKVDNGKGIVQEICPNPVDFRNEMVFVFDKQVVRNITIRIEQLNAYSTQIGHEYYTEIGMGTNFLEPISTEGDRVDGPKQSVELLGIRYEPFSGLFKQPEMGSVYIAPQSTRLFLPLNSDTTASTGTELVRGTRYQIGIRDIQAACIDFTIDSDYISVPFTFSQPIDHMILEKIDYVPQAFGSGEWIQYFISVDNCSTWVKIIPGQICMFIHPAASVRVMIKLTRPIGATKTQYQTPIVYQYVIKGRKGT